MYMYTCFRTKGVCNIHISASKFESCTVGSTSMKSIQFFTSFSNSTANDNSNIRTLSCTQNEERKYDVSERSQSSSNRSIINSPNNKSLITSYFTPLKRERVNDCTDVTNTSKKPKTDENTPQQDEDVPLNTCICPQCGEEVSEWVYCHSFV